MNDENTREKEISANELANEIDNDPQFETALHEAAEIPVPEGLADRILARHTIALNDETEDDNVVSIDQSRAAAAARD